MTVLTPVCMVDMKGGVDPSIKKLSVAVVLFWVGMSQSDKMETPRREKAGGGGGSWGFHIWVNWGREKGIGGG